MDISIESLGVCMDLISGWRPSIALPDGSTNLNAPEQTRKVAVAREEILAALLAKQNAQQQAAGDDVHHDTPARNGDGAVGVSSAGKGKVVRPK